MKTGCQKFGKDLSGELLQDVGDALQSVDIACLGLGKRVEQALRLNKIRTLSDLFTARDIGYMFVHGIGAKAARSIETALSALAWGSLQDLQESLQKKAAEDMKLERAHKRFHFLLSGMSVRSLHGAWTDVNLKRLKHLLNSPIEEIHLPRDDMEALVATGCRFAKHALRFLRRGPLDNDSGFVQRVKNSIMWHLEVGIGGLSAAKARVPRILRSSLCQPLLSLADLVPTLLEAFGQTEREGYIWRRRIGLGEQGHFTLAQLSEELQISRERVRQIEMRLSTRIADFIHNPFKGFVQDVLLPPQLIALLENARARIRAQPQLISLRRASEILDIGIPDLKLCQRLVRLLLKSFGFVKVGAVGSILAPIEVWSADATLEIKLVRQALQQTKEYLCIRPWPEKSDVIAHALEKNGMPKKYTEFVLDTSPEVANVKPGQYELKFDALPNLADKAYRILARADVVMRMADIASAIKSASIDDEGQVNPRSVAGQMVVDDRFRRGGQSGEWGLAAWPIGRETIPQLARRLFTEGGPVIPIAEAEKLLRTWRPDVTQAYISNYLRRANLFYIDDAGGVRQIEPSRPGRRDVQRMRSEEIQAEFIQAVGEHTRDAVANDDRSFTLKLHNQLAPSIRVYLFELGVPVLNGNALVYRHQVTQGSSAKGRPIYFLSQDGAFPLLVGYVDEYSTFVFWDTLLHDGKRYAHTVTVNERTVVSSLSGHVAEQQRSLREGLEETVLAAHRSQVGEAIQRRWELHLGRLTA